MKKNIFIFAIFHHQLTYKIPPLLSFRQADFRYRGIQKKVSILYTQKLSRVLKCCTYIESLAFMRIRRLLTNDFIALVIRERTSYEVMIKIAIRTIAFIPVTARIAN